MVRCVLKIYIAGPMTGYPDYNRTAFFSKAKELMEEGHIVLNPALLPAGLCQSEYMDICLAMVRSADAIYLLKGWDVSAGARAEHALAEKLGLTVIYEAPSDTDCRMAAHHLIYAITGNYSVNMQLTLPMSFEEESASEYRHDNNDRYAPKFRSGTSRLALHHVPYMAMAGFHFPETVEKTAQTGTTPEGIRSVL